MLLEELVALADPLVSQLGPVGIRPRTPDDIETIVAIAAELAAHNPVSPTGWRWWVDAVAWRAAPRTLFLGTLARDTQVSGQHLASGHLTRDEAAAICAFMTDYRDRVFGATLAYARDELATVVDAMRDAGPELAFVAAGAREQITILDAASAPLEPFFREQDNATTVAVVDGSPVLAPVRVDAGAPRPAPLQCSGCGKVWTPRVLRPVRCPSCQRAIRWPVASSTIEALP